MCPPGSFPSLDIGTYWTDEQIILFLDQILHGSYPPSYVIEDVNPYDYKPANLPDDVWYLLPPESRKVTDTGHWKAKGEKCEVYSNTEITGWRSTLEFYEGRFPNRHKTDWVMQEYSIADKGLSIPRTSRSLCRLFLCDGGRNPTTLHQQGSEDVGLQSNNALADAHSNKSGEGSVSQPQVNVGHTEPKVFLVGDYLLDDDYISRGDYLALEDLANSQASSSNSDISSSVSISSDDYFDSEALLRELEPQNSGEHKPDLGHCKFSVSASCRPNEVLVQPASKGSVVNKTSQPQAKPLKLGCLLPAPTLLKKHHDKTASKETDQVSTSETAKEVPTPNFATSASRKSARDKGKKVSRGKRKMRKYLCFMPF